MVTSLVTLVTFLLVGAALSENVAPDVDAAAKFVIATLADDDFNTVKTTEKTEGDDEDSRKKRSAVHSGAGAGASAGGFLGRFGAGQTSYGYPTGCGSAPSGGTVFMRCFTPGSGGFQGPVYERNYYRAGNYGDCLNYFNSLPLRNVAPIGDGYTGTLNGPGNTAFQVDACQRCFGGNSGISVQGVGRPYNHYKRNFIFRVNLGIQRAYDGYNGYGREYGGLYGYNGAPSSYHQGSACVGAGCGGGFIDGIGDGRGIYNPCVGDGCSGVAPEGYYAGVGAGSVDGGYLTGGAGFQNRGVVDPSLAARLNPGLGQPGDGCVGAGCRITGHGLGGRVDSGCIGTRCQELGRIVGSGIDAGRGFVDDNGCSSRGVC